MKYKELLLEEGMPIWNDAKRILESSIIQYKHEKVTCMVIIHGYGSTGKGGTLRTKTRNLLKTKLECNEIKTLTYGEHFDMYDEVSRRLNSTYKELSVYYGRYNEGITIIEI